MQIVASRARSAPYAPVVLLAATLLGSCGGGSGSGGTAPPPPSPPPPDPPITIVTSALPNAQVGHAYSATLTATGGTAPLSWALSAGPLPAGLTLAASGVLSGTPTATAAGTPLTFTVSDAGTPAQTKSVTLTLNVSPAAITVAISPQRAAIAVTQTLSLVATTNDYGGVTWSVSPAGGSLSSTTSASGAAVTFTAPTTAGLYTITATGVTDTTQHGAVTIAVTDLTGVYTYHNDLARDGMNTHEYALTPANVNTTTFGKLFSCTADGAIYAQPLWVANLSVGGSRHNVVFVATAHDSLYAFDADTSPCLQLWQVSLIDVNHGGSAGETTVPSGTTGHLVGMGFGNIVPEVGVIGTPVIDPASGTLYVVSKSMNAAGTSFYQRLHAIDVTNGNEKSGSPLSIAASVPGTAEGGSSIAFSARQQNQRAGLALVNGIVYVAWGSHEDATPWYGWIISYSFGAGGFTRSAVLNTAPDGGGGGVWMGGGAPAADASGNLYAITGNGAFDVTNSSGPTDDYGDSFLQLSGGLHISSWFTPTDQANLAANDFDFGAGGAALVLSQSTGPLQHLVVGGGKNDVIYVVNGDSMGGYGDGNVWQELYLSNHVFSTAAFWNNTLYIATKFGPLLAYAFDSTTDMFNTTPTSQSPTIYGTSGATASVSASGASSHGIVWGIDSTNFCGTATCGPAVLRAYDATNLATELWNSSLVGSDFAGNAVKFTVPTVANGRVYVGTRGNNTGGAYGSTSISGELDVYGLKPD